MEIFINELSLHEQYNSETEFTKAIIEFSNIVSLLNKEIKSNQIFKDGYFIHNRKAVYNQVFLSSFEKIRDKFVKNSFRDILFNKSNPKDWREEQRHLPDDEYFCNSLNEIVNDTSIAEISERKIQTENEIFLLLNFIDSAFKNLYATEVIKNKNVKIDIDCIESKVAALKWIEKNSSHEIILKDIKRFKPTNRVSVLNTKIYEELSTTYYWYFDNFHRTHFEVFDRAKNHIGEANLEGEIDVTKKDVLKNGRIDI